MEAHEEALLKGNSHQAASSDERVTFRFGPFEFDQHRRELRRNGHRISMSASQMRLLTLFMERPGELIGREDIAACLWAETGTIDVATGINTAINRLRRQLQLSPGGPNCIETVIGLGYRFVADLEEVKSAAEEPDPPSSATSSSQPGVAVPNAPPTSLKEQPEVVGLDSGLALLRPQGESYPLAGRSRAALFGRWVALLALCGLVLLSVAVFHSLQRRTGPSAKNSAATAPDGALHTTALARITADEEVGMLTAAAVAPSGTSLAYANRFGVSVHWFASGAERLLGTRPSFTVNRLAWLPKDAGLLMSGRDEISHHQEVWLVPLQGAYLRLLVQDANRATMSPDGSLIAFTRSNDRELWIGDAEGQHARRLRSADTGESFGLVLWSSGGNRLIVTQRKLGGTGGTGTNAAVNPPDQETYECLDSASGQVLDREEGFFADSGYLLPDGRFYFAANVTPGPTTGVANLMMVRTDPGSGRFLSTPKIMRDLAARIASLTASSSGAHFAALLDRSEIDVFVGTLRQPDPELTNVVRLTHGAKENYPHAWAADAKGVLFENNSLGKYSIFYQRLDSSTPTLIASLPGSAAMAQLSPDGQWILFLEFEGHPSHATGIFRIPATGGKIEQVPTRGMIEEFHCSASATGRCVMREAVGNEVLVYYALDPITGMGKELGRTRWQPNRLGDWGLSADGSEVAFASHDTQHPSIQLLKLSAEPTQVRSIAVPGYGTTLGANWATDGKSLFVECRTETGFALLSLDLAGHVKLLRESASLIWAVPSRDGKKVAFPGATMSTSVWASNE